MCSSERFPALPPAMLSPIQQQRELPYERTGKAWSVL